MSKLSKKEDKFLIHLHKLLTELKQYSKHVREIEYEPEEACGIEFAVEVIENAKFPDWVKKEEYNGNL